MKINKQKFVQLMKEAYSKKLVTEDGEEQGETLVGNNPPADVVAVVRAVNARLQGKAEYLTASQAFLEYLLEWSEEGAVLGDLQTVCNELMEKSKMKGAGSQLFTALKKASEIYRQGKAAKAAREPGQKTDQGQQIKNDQGRDQDLQSFLTDIDDKLKTQARTRVAFEGVLMRVIRAMNLNDQEARKTLDDAVEKLIKNNKESLPFKGTQNEDVFFDLQKRYLK